jgi:NAD(P)-dependent dehydrogenase (short-subunit alcohol dehydrogenase family)
VARRGDVELLVANAGVSGPDGATWEIDPADWWRVQEINVLGVHLCCRTVIPQMLERGSGRIVITASGRRLPARVEQHRVPDEQGRGRPLRRDARERARGRIPVFFFSPGLVKTAMTGTGATTCPWTPPELAPQLVACSPRAARMRSPGDTSTRSTTTSRI